MAQRTDENWTETWIATNNIAQFEKQIKAETDDSVRKVLTTLLAKEKAKLAALPKVQPLS